LIEPPNSNTFGYEEWLYGIGKRGAEDVLATAWAERQFPYTSLRLPMVNSERDPFNRLYNYMLRINDGGPILIPQQPQ
jgi:nucleoside-diphosphate-sugar epimerase